MGAAGTCCCWSRGSKRKELDLIVEIVVYWDNGFALLLAHLWILTWPRGVLATLSLGALLLVVVVVVVAGVGVGDEEK